MRGRDSRDALEAVDGKVLVLGEGLVDGFDDFRVHRVLADDDEGVRSLAGALVGRADDCGVEHVGVRQQQALQLGGRDLHNRAKKGREGEFAASVILGRKKPALGIF